MNRIVRERASKFRASPAKLARLRMSRSHRLLFVIAMALCGAGCDDAISATSKPSSDSAHDELVFVKGGTFRMGTDDGFPYEAPAHDVTVKSFWIDRHELTVAKFEQFVRASGYKTDAEKFGWSGVFDPKAAGWM